MADGGRVTSLKPARQAKRKEADATGPQGGYGIRLACSSVRAKGMPNVFLVSFFISIKFYRIYISLKFKYKYN